MRIRWALRLGLALAFMGCGGERRAGTEVGNPEITVSARFSVRSYGGIGFRALPFQVMGMGYAIAHPGRPDDSGKCWSRPGGTLTDFAAIEGMQLPDTAIEDEGTWPFAEIVLRAPEAPAILPDTGDINAWSNPRYARFGRQLMGAYRSVLFEMPQGAEFHLLFDSASVDSWRVGDEIWVPFEINADAWTDTLLYYSSYKTRQDGKGNGYILLSPAENAGAWRALKAALPDAFYADSVFVR